MASAAQINPLAIGDLAATDSETGVTLSLTAPLSGGSGTSLRYRIYRDTQPLVPTNGAPLATVESLPYTDTTAVPGTLYFYKVVGSDSTGATIAPIPAGLGEPGRGLAVAGQALAEAWNIVYIGDSITQGAGIPDPATQAPPATCSDYLRSWDGLRAVYFSNQGHSGHTTTDYLPGGSDMAGAEQAAKSLQTAHPTGRLIFHIMLGTNDSATTGTNVPARTPEQITANLNVIALHLLDAFPAATVFIAYAPYYTPNTRNGSDYQEAGLARLLSYGPAIDRTVATVNRTHPGHAFVGDRTATAYFAAHYQTALIPENGRVGTFYLHPNPRGAADLGRLWAQGIVRALAIGRGDHR
jgi:lysophospholipase L1-like esterase